MPELIPPLKPRRTYGYLSVAVLAVVAVIALAAAWGALVSVERGSKSAVARALFLAGEDWAEVDTNGLQVFLSGKAPSEAARFAALSAAGREVDGARVIDLMVLPEAVAIEPPRFSIEMLRNQAGISLIGLIPEEIDRAALAERLRAINPIQPVADFLETAEHPTPDGWEDAVEFALYAAAMLPRSKISMDAEHVAVEAIAGSPDQKATWERAIRRKRPAGLRLALDIRAPHEVVSPFIMRFIANDDGTRFDACTAYTEAGRFTIVSAGIAAGVKGAVDCTIGLGVPSPDWPEAVARGIRAVREMGGGTLTFSDADITLVAAEDTPQDTYDRVIGELEADLPEVFSLHGVLPVSETGPARPAGPPEFIATLGDGGNVQLRGRVASEQDRTVVESLARARFGTRKVYAPLRLDPGLPASWAVRTLAGLEALDQLAEGRVVVRPDVVTVTGATGDKGASAEISRLLSEKLGEAQDFRVNVKYEEALDPIAAMPTPQECAADINAVLARNKITFAPGSAEIERSSLSTVDRIAEIVKSCSDVAMEIGGYTDSQGREEMNRALSQRRAEAVVSALLARRVLTTNLAAFGYGEATPIADNDTEDGREANRRIEFRLVGETRPLGDAERDAGDPPTIRPPARPADRTGDGEGADADAGADDAAGAPEGQPEGQPEDGGGGSAGQAGTAEDSNAGDIAAAGETTGLAEDADEAAPLEPEATGDGAEEGTEAYTEADLAGGGADPEAPSVATEPDITGVVPDPVTAAAEATDAAGEAVPEEATTETAAPDAGTALEGPAMDTAADVTEDAALDAAPAETDAAALTPQTGTGADVTATTPETGADPAAGGSTAGGVDADPTPPDAAPDEDTPGEAAPAATDSAVDAGETAPDAGGTESSETDTPTEAPEGAVPAPETPASEDVATEPSAEDVSPPGPDETVTDAETDAVTDADTGVVEEAPGAAEVADPAHEAGTPEPPAESDEASADAGADASAGASADAGAGTIRPRPRPPLVVHADLEGVRPRPRPADIPDAPSTE